MATTLYRRGRVHTPDPVPRPPSSWARRSSRMGGRRAEGADRARRRGRRRRRPRGAHVLPAFVDAHVHLSHTGHGAARRRPRRHAARSPGRCARSRMPPAAAAADRSSSSTGRSTTGWRTGRSPRPSSTGQPSAGSSTPRASTATPPSSPARSRRLGRRPAGRLAGRRAGHPRRQERRARGLRRRAQPRPAPRGRRGRAAGRRRRRRRAPRVRWPAADLRRGLRRRPRARAAPRPAADRRLLGRGGHRPRAGPGPRRAARRRRPGGDLNIDGSIGSHTAHLREAYTDDAGCPARRSGQRRGPRPRGGVRGWPASRAASTSSATRAWTPCSTATRRPPRSSGSTPCGPPGPGSSTPRWSTPRASPGWRGSGWSRASSRPSTPSGAARGDVRARLGRDAGAGHEPVRLVDRAGRAAGARLGLAGHAVRPLGHRARRRRAPRGRHSASTRHRVAAHTSGGWAAAHEDGGGVLRVGGPATFAVWAVPETGPGGLPPSPRGRGRRAADLPADAARRRGAAPGLGRTGRRPAARAGDRSCRQRPVAP